MTREPQAIPGDPYGRQRLSRYTIYPIAAEDRVKATMVAGASEVRAMWTGEKRMPKRGEWFLSGAKIEAYLAPNDLSTEEAIAGLVKGEVTIRWVPVTK